MILRWTVASHTCSLRLELLCSARDENEALKVTTVLSSDVLYNEHTLGSRWTAQGHAGLKHVDRLAKAVLLQRHPSTAEQQDPK